MHINCFSTMCVFVTSSWTAVKDTLFSMILPIVSQYLITMNHFSERGQFKMFVTHVHSETGHSLRKKGGFQSKDLFLAYSTGEWKHFCWENIDVLAQPLTCNLKYVTYLLHCNNRSTYVSVLWMTWLPVNAVFCSFYNPTWHRRGISAWLSLHLCFVVDHLSFFVLDPKLVWRLYPHVPYSIFT